MLVFPASQSYAFIQIQHPKLHDFGMTYLMPLADGLGASDPRDPNWRPLTLSVLLELRKSERLWFQGKEICAWLITILDALQLLSDAGLVHRDVKPDNILFFNGIPCLADIGLLGADASQLTRRGTPGYSAPSWFTETSGHPDVYGVATTFYTMLTGNSPDKMGRAAFRWPPQGEASLSPDERLEWLRFHRIIRRAVDDRPAERFIDFKAFALSLSQAEENSDSDNVESTNEGSLPHLPAASEKNTGRRERFARKAILLSLPLLGFGGYAAYRTLSHKPAAEASREASHGLKSEIPWVSASMVLESLKNC
ncbi:MAG: hypothetical protein EBS01_12740, partial [Verrucomicrobia bacterium]|nr:hypothetical protein [Verrucomicrobiota bacterium]